MKKKILTIAGVPLLVAALLFLGLYINGTCRYRNQKAEEFYSSWMAEIPDDTPLREVVIPGSHDAGTVGMPWLGRTQNYSIGTQLTFGARYFDIRINKTEDGYQIYHGFMNGADFNGILKDIVDFITSRPSEVLILDFMYFNGGSKEDVFAFLSEELEKKNLVVRNNKGISDVEFIHSLTVGEARGKCLVIWGETDSAPEDWLFVRNNDDGTKNDVVLDSFYFEDNHKGGFESLTTEAHPQYFERRAEKQEAGSDGIFVLQCQLTDGMLILGPWTVERHQEEKMDAYVRELKDKAFFGGVNVVMRDFLTPEKCADIVALNKAKGFMK